jgi:hypothetical protein
MIVAMRSRPDRTENLLTALLVVVTALMAVATLASLGLFVL